MFEIKESYAYLNIIFMELCHQYFSMQNHHRVRPWMVALGAMFSWLGEVCFSKEHYHPHSTCWSLKVMFLFLKPWTVGVGGRVHHHHYTAAFEGVRRKRMIWGFAFVWKCWYLCSLLRSVVLLLTQLGRAFLLLGLWIRTSPDISNRS